MTKTLFSTSLKATTGGESRPHIQAVRESLRRHASHLTSSDHEKVVAGLLTDGLARDGGPVYASAAADDHHPQRRHQLMSPVQAARDERLHPMLPYCQRVLARCGYSLDLSSGEIVRLYDIDQALKKSDLDVEGRMAIKSQLHLCGLLD